MSSPPPPAIAVSGVWKIFGARAAAAYQAVRRRNLSKQQTLEEYDCVIGVADAAFEVQTGQIYCIMGLSGSGKSTLVRHINRLLQPTAGQVRVGQTDVMALTPRALQQFRNRRIAMVFQNFALMPHRSVLDNIALPLEIRGMGKNERLAIAERHLHRVELDGWGNKYAHELSGGMQQRIGLARALAADADILLMDEPFSALDPLIRRQLQSQFMTLAAQFQKTTLFITHDLAEAARIGDRIAIMRDGRIIQEDTPENIILHPANAYIADFVAGISRLKVVRARAVMTPLAEFHRHHPATDPPPYRRFPDHTPLATLVTALSAQDHPVIITDAANAANTDIGIVTHRDLLTAIRADDPDA